jgi:DNA glycosylase AlkZ-like
MRVLSLRELNRATLARQLLLERSSLSVPRAIERVACLQAQWPPAPYVGLWSRLENFDRRTLERLILRRAVVKATLMRSTLHLATSRDYAVFGTLALRGLRSWGDAVVADAEAVAGGLRELCLQRPLTFAEAIDYIGREHGHRDLHARRVWYVARRRAHLHHAPETALWTSKPEGRYVAFADEPDGHDSVAARAELARRYLAAFGPATRADLADWSGLRVSDFAEALEALEPLRRFRSEEGRELLDLPRAPLPPPDTPAPVRFLPKWDSVLLGHADRRRVLPEEYRKVVIAKNGDVAQTFLVDGVVAGTWRVDGSQVDTTAFAPLPRDARTAVEDEAARLAAWIA